MARQKEFDQVEVLSKAMQLFWYKGYEATSVQDLVDYLGIGRGSLYDTFGDKYKLYLAALDLYRRTEGRKAFAPLTESGPIKEAIAQVFRNLVEEALLDTQQRGCFMVNATLELVPHDSEVAARSQHTLKLMEQGFYQALIKAEALGELPDDRNWRGIARFLANAVLGLRVMAKINPDPQALRDVVSNTLAILE